MYHLRLYFSPVADGLTLFGYGFTGVSFFFILSGFVLTWSQDEDVKHSAFYWNRVARIWPLHILTTAVAILVPPLPTSSGSGWLAAPFVLTLTQAWIPASPFLNAFNGVSWSLSCEAFFYLAFPLLHVKLASIRAAARVVVLIPAAMLVLGVGLAFASSMAAADYLLGTMPLYRLGEFVLGICLAKLMKRGWRPRFNTLHAILLVAILTAGLFIGSSILNGMNGPLPVIVADLVMMPGFLALIAACAGSNMSGKTGLLGSPILLRLGQWSYALYLVHELIIRVTRPYLENLSIGEASALAALAVIISVALSGFLHEFVEEPAERWLRQRYQQWNQQRVQHS